MLEKKAHVERVQEGVCTRRSRLLEVPKQVMDISIQPRTEDMMIAMGMVFRIGKKMMDLKDMR
jgi:hypothetical protein